MSPSLHDFLLHIINECRFLINVKEGKEKDILLNDETASRAIIRSLEVIGEATKKLPDDFRLTYSHIPWAEIAGMRDVLIHNYFGVDYDIVWNTINNDIPFLYAELLHILDSEKID